VAGGQVIDYPRYGHRGAMLDVSRHFFPVATVERYIDEIALYKLNVLHLHLSDDQGWRIAIDSWPNLAVHGGSTAVDGDPGGYYTKDDYRGIVAYAASRFITVVPEIDLPGHTNAALSSYAELNCDGIAPPLYTGTEVGFSSLCVPKEITYTFIDQVVGEIAALTPGPYIHIGGDEAFATPPEDYRTFMTRVLPLVGKYGKRAIGWHEIAAVELPPTAIPQYWRIEASNDGVARAAAAGHQVIMSPADRTYLDMKYEKYDESSPLGLDWAGLVGIHKSYDWDPADRLPGVGEESVLGVEAALWSETLRSLDDVCFMTFPRLAAIAEVAWTPRAARDWEPFSHRLGAFGPRWSAQGINFHPDPEIDWEF
jgi:hexosaminidase